VLLALTTALSARAANWTQPTPDQLKMTADPSAPGAEAVYLFREETVDDRIHYHRIYAQIKILNEKGKEDYSDIEIPYEAGVSDIKAVEGRTIHPDGSVVPFTGKPFSKELVKAGNTKIMARVFSMPDVQVGSILEYRYELSYQDNYVIPPDWLVQQSLYVHQAHYHFVPVDLSTGDFMVTDALGHANLVHGILYYKWLPPNAVVRQGFDGFDVTVSDIPALPSEEFTPPLSSFAYRVKFYYAADTKGADYWKEEGKYWSKDVDRFANPSDPIRAAVAQIVAPGDTDDQKLQKIYAAVMKIENTRFTREHSAAENQSEGLRVRTASDIWAQKRGSDDEITRLFISMARAAGFKAYAMIVTERDRAVLNLGILDWGQLEDEIAIVNVGGKEVFFDPGQRYCEYGKLHWMHSEMIGVRQLDEGTKIATTPRANYPDNELRRFASLVLGPDGAISGQVRITMSGQDALRWRQAALRTDEQQARKDFEAQLQERVPPGVKVSMNHFLSLADPSAPLMAVLDVSGNIGTATGKRAFLPASFFQANVKPLFATENRESSIDLHYPFVSEDTVSITLPTGFTVQSVPHDATIPYSQNAAYKAKYAAANGTFEEDRVEAIGNVAYLKSDYPQLRDFYGKMNAQDQQQIVLEKQAVTAAR
jgi:Domain of Unknown Function with PDB structure (DUF3857)/Transglutaminase-like superfamily